MATNKKAYSKINLILKVYRSLRQETKHRILGLFCLHKEIYDEIDIKPSKKLLIKYFVNNKNVIIDNCSIKNSITYMKNKHGIDTNLNIRVQKNIPLMSGIGGSASDAAYVIKWLCNKHKIPLDKLDTKDIALTLGSDIPFFLSSYSAALVSGYGETIKL
jgi:4-diphosphocytidyl-2-C-methyl-D-erythritol kinase